MPGSREIQPAEQETLREQRVRPGPKELLEHPVREAQKVHPGQKERPEPKERLGQKEHPGRTVRVAHRGQSGHDG